MPLLNWEVTTPYMGKNVKFYSFKNAWTFKELYSGTLKYKGKPCPRWREIMMCLIDSML